MSGIFLDTSALFDAADRTSAHHATCAVELGRLLRSAEPLLTTTLILAEVHALTLARAGAQRALEAARRITDSARIEVLDVGVSIVDNALALLEQRADQRYSLADATSFVIMRARSIGVAFALDAGFRTEGFATVPTREGV